MTKALVKGLLGGAALAALATVASAPQAHAACYWGGFGWACAPSPQTAYVSPYYPYAPMTAPAWGYNYGNYNQIPNDYPGPATTDERY